MFFSEAFEFTSNGSDGLLPAARYQFTALSFEWLRNSLGRLGSLEGSAGGIADVAGVLGIGTIANHLESSLLGGDFNAAEADAGSAK